MQFPFYIANPPALSLYLSADGICWISLTDRESCKIDLHRGTLSMSWLNVSTSKSLLANTFSAQARAQRGH